jgi:hypothetical protein
MIVLRGLPPAMSSVMMDIHGDVFEMARNLMLRDKYVIFEEVLYRDNKLRYRKEIKWPAIRDALTEHFQCDIMNISRATFRDSIHSKFNPLPTLQHVKDYLSKGNGNQTAGFGFVHWKREVTERKIAARKHTAKGFHDSADQLMLALQQALQLEQLQEAVKH